MASTGAVIYIRPQMLAARTVARSTGAVMYFAPRMLAGLWTSSGVTASRDLSNLKAWLPPARIPIGYVNGDRTKPVLIDEASWYKFLNYFLNVFIGGQGAPTFSDVVTTVEQTQATAVEASSQTAALAQTTQTNAEALAATIQVSQNSGLAGASQIPPVKFNPYEIEP
jgi:hypothetical protein